MHKALGWVLPVLLSVFVIEVVSDALYFRATGSGASERDAAPLPSTRAPKLPVHELDREASAGAMFT